MDWTAEDDQLDRLIGRVVRASALLDWEIRELTKTVCLEAGVVSKPVAKLLGVLYRPPEGSGTQRTDFRS
jgi:hypothetical protein